jgi:putative transposase
LDTLWQQTARRLCEKHVTYGYRRICVLLRRSGHEVGQHKVRLWTRDADLSQRGSVKDTGRTVGEKPQEPTRPNEAWQIDATKTHTSKDGWVWQTSVLDLFDRRVVSYVLRKTCSAEDAMDAVALALEEAYRGNRPDGLSLIHDRGSQFTAFSFREMVRGLRIRDIVTAVRHPQSCGRLERFHRTLKEECIWLSEWEGLEDLKEGVAEYMRHYNWERIHSALGYRTPMQAHWRALAEQSSHPEAA